MNQVFVSDAALREAAEKDMDAFVKVFTDAIYESIGGQLDAETMGRLNANQVTLLAYCMMRDEVMDGGFVQLIHNGNGPFFFRNPFAKALKQWGLRELGKLVYEAGHLYNKFGSEIEADCTDEEFMALFERFPQFDDLDDDFVENEERWTSEIAHYIDEHIEQFAEVR